MISFECDYNNGVHQKILQRFAETNNKQSLTYGTDEWSESAKGKIRKACDSPNADIFFISGGTQTNMVVIDGMLAGYQSVICAETGHINIHEAGAVEFTGHKVVTLKEDNGKIDATDLDHYMNIFANDDSMEHLAIPGLVYITFPTEYGTIYKAEEISNIYKVCKKYELKLYIDGARLGYGIMSEKSDIDLSFIAHNCDAFYIGGTKVGALFGEGVVFPQGNAPKHFFSIIKQHGALMAKGRAIGLQFDTLFTDNLYFNISKHAIDYAGEMKQMFINKGYKFYIDSPTNQQFVIIPNEKVKELDKKVIFTHWGPYDENNFICRFVTSWSTTKEQMDYLESVI